MTLKFTPPKEEQKKFPRYASYSAGTMKTHGGLGFAKNSLNNRMWVRESDSTGEIPYYSRMLVTTHSFILEMVSGEYFVLYEIKPGLTKEQLPWMKEFFHVGYGGWSLVEEYKDNSYYGPKLRAGEYRTAFRPVQMTKEEYADWRIKVELERRGLTEDLTPFQ